MRGGEAQVVDVVQDAAPLGRAAVGIIERSVGVVSGALVKVVGNVKPTFT